MVERRPGPSTAARPSSLLGLHRGNAEQVGEPFSPSSAIGSISGPAPTTALTRSAMVAPAPARTAPRRSRARRRGRARTPRPGTTRRGPAAGRRRPPRPAVDPAAYRRWPRERSTASGVQPISRSAARAGARAAAQVEAAVRSGAEQVGEHRPHPGQVGRGVDREPLVPVGVRVVRRRHGRTATRPNRSGTPAGPLSATRWVRSPAAVTPLSRSASGTCHAPTRARTPCGVHASKVCDRSA